MCQFNEIISFVQIVLSEINVKVDSCVPEVMPFHFSYLMCFLIHQGKNFVFGKNAVTFCGTILPNLLISLDYPKPQ